MHLDPTTPRFVDCTCQWCGQPFQVRRHQLKHGRGKYCSRSCAAHGNAWGGGRTIKDGYVFVLIEGKQYPEHRVIMEKHLGRPLRGDEHVHHIDGNRQNNAIGNLRIVTPGEHTRIHHPGNKHLPPGQWSRRYAKCRECGTTEVPHCGNGYCRNCFGRLWYRRATVKGGSWAKHYSCCVKCGTTARKHIARGLCRNCYADYFRKNLRHSTIHTHVGATL